MTLLVSCISWSTVFPSGLIISRTLMWPLPATNVLRGSSRNLCLEITEIDRLELSGAMEEAIPKGTIGSPQLWATWKAPFLKGRRGTVLSLFLVPSGNTQSLTWSTFRVSPTELILSAACWMLFLSMKTVPHRYAVIPKRYDGREKRTNLFKTLPKVP